MASRVAGLLLSFVCLAACPAPRSAVDAAPGGPAWVDPGAGPVDVLVRAQVERSAAAGRRVLVVVGAPWCEPCVRFHDAVKRGELDTLLRGWDLLEFNLDVDKDRLQAAGYASRMVPLLVVPGPDGRAGPRRMEGSIKGEGAVAQMTPRLAELLR